MSEKDLLGVSITESDEPKTSDEKVLNSLGYSQQFKREFSLWSCFSVSFSVIGLLPSIASVLFYGIGYAGLPGISWGWPIAASGIIAISLSMAELASSAPTSGGLYYTAFILSPPGWGPFFSWMTGWSNWLGQVTWMPSVNYGLSNMIYALAVINNPSFVPKNWHIYLLCLALMTIHSVIASLPTGQLASINGFSTLLNIVVYIIVFVTLLAGNRRSNPKWNSNYQVWQQLTNNTDYPDGIAILMSFLAAIWSQAGFDAAFHISEECSNAQIAVPRSIVLTTTLGSLFGWFLMLVIAYTMVDLDEVLNSDIGLPFATFTNQVVGKTTSTALISLIATCSFFMASSCGLTASRVLFAYARDGCFPFSKLLSEVNPHTKTPVNAVWANYVIGILLLLLAFNTSAINAIFSLGATAAYIAFITPVILRVFYIREKFQKGPWHLGKYSKFVGVYAISFVILMIPILSFPQTTGANLEAANMNWTSLVYFGPMMFALLWYICYARKWFKGPKINETIAHLDKGLKLDL